MEALWGTRVNAGTVSNINKKIYLYVYLDGIVLKRKWGRKVREISALVAIGVDEDGFGQVLGVVLS